jgi:GDP-mannose 6-dehydrogenase
MKVAVVPHLNRLLKRELGAALNGADVAMVSSTDPAVQAALLATSPPRLPDLNGRLRKEVESLPGYERIG